jgi:hypothetical protein
MLQVLRFKSKELFPFGNHALNLFQHAIDAGHHIAGGEPDHVKAVTVQPCGPTYIVQRLRRFGMLIAVNFNNQANRQAAQIREIWPERKLPSEPMAVHGLAAKVAPYSLFCFGGLYAQFARTLSWVRPPPPSNRLLRIQSLAPSRKGRGEFLARALSIIWHHENSAPTLRITF